jgi:hypothetical protein
LVPRAIGPGVREERGVYVTYLAALGTGWFEKRILMFVTIDV